MPASAYAREITLTGRSFSLYAIPEEITIEAEHLSLRQSMGYEFSIFQLETPPKLPEDLKLIWLPIEESFLTALLFGERRAIVDEMNEAIKDVRKGLTKTKCFLKGCMKEARFYAEREGSTWYACDKEHMSKTTTTGLPLKESDYNKLWSNPKWKKIVSAEETF